MKAPDVYPAFGEFMFFSNDTAPGTFINNDCNPTECGTDVGTGKPGIGVVVMHGEAPCAVADTKYRFCIRDTATADGLGAYICPLLDFCSNISGMGYRTIRLEITSTTITMLENGTELYTGPNPLPGLMQGYVFFGAYSDQVPYPTTAYFDNVNIFAL